MTISHQWRLVPASACLHAVSNVQGVTTVNQSLMCGHRQHNVRNSASLNTALHGIMQTRCSDENNKFCLSVRPSVCQTRDDLRQNGRKICGDFYTIRKSIPIVFWEEECYGWGDAFYLKFWVNRPSLEQNCRFSTDIRPSAVTPSE